MAAPAPHKIAVPQNTWKPVVDTSCRVMCPECDIQGTVIGLEDDHTLWGCGKCGQQFSLDWGQ